MSTLFSCNIFSLIKFYLFSSAKNEQCSSKANSNDSSAMLSTDVSEKYNNLTWTENNQRNVLPFELFCYCCHFSFCTANIEWHTNERCIYQVRARFISLNKDDNVNQQTSSHFKRIFSLRFLHFSLSFALSRHLYRRCDPSFIISNYFLAHFPSWWGFQHWRILLIFRETCKKTREKAKIRNSKAERRIQKTRTNFDDNNNNRIDMKWSALNNFTHRLVWRCHCRCRPLIEINAGARWKRNRMHLSIECVRDYLWSEQINERKTNTYR